MFGPHQNLWKVSVSMLFLCRLQKAVVMEAHHTLKDSILFKALQFKARELVLSGSSLQHMRDF